MSRSECLVQERAQLLALVAGAVRGIPLWLRMIDCGFGVIGGARCWSAGG